MYRIKTGDQLIAFKKVDYLGNIVNIEEYKSKKLLLSFFRGASCPFCNLRVHQLIKRYSEFEENNIQIITIFNASREEIFDYAGKQNAPFPIIPDPNLEIYKLYDIEESYLEMFKTMLQLGKMWKVMTSGFFNFNSITEKPLVPADFLIDQNQKFFLIYHGKDFGDHLPIDQILNWTQ